MPDSLLIIEDDPTMGRVLRDNFELLGFKVQAAADGQTGLEKARALNPSLILLDIMIPVISGYEVCRRIRASDDPTPIVMLTAKGQTEDIVKGLNLGADDYVVKPFDINVLIARVEAMLRRSRATMEDALTFGDHRLDDSARRLFRRDREIILTPKEYRLLRHLLINAGRAITRNRLLDAVWGDELIVSPRSVDRCVTTLRGKIESDPRRPVHLRTIREVGYRFEK